jgi:CRP-like cAMP-binding protein
VNCVALDELVVMYATRDTLLFLIPKVPSLAINIARVLSRLIEQLEERISPFAGGPLRHRLSVELIDLSSGGSQETDGWIRLSGAITHALPASLVGASREAVTLALGKLRESGAVKQIGKGTLVVRPEVLNAIAGISD